MATQMRETDVTDRNRHAETGADLGTGTRDDALQEETEVMTDMNGQDPLEKTTESKDQGHREAKVSMLASAKRR